LKCGPISPPGASGVHHVDESRTGRGRKRPVRGEGRAPLEVLLVDRTRCLEQAALASGVRVDVLAGSYKVSSRQLRLGSVLPAPALSDPHPSSAHTETAGVGAKMPVGQRTQGARRSSRWSDGCCSTPIGQRGRPALDRPVPMYVRRAIVDDA
jgi:hypothetical protein